MPALKEAPEKLRPYLFHGLDLTWDNKQATGDCPFCGRDGKLGIELETGKYKCWVCSAESKDKGGNAFVFLRKLWEASYEQTSDYSELAENRGLGEATLIQWQVAKSITTRDWIVPGYNTSGNLIQLYRYVDNGKRKLLMATPRLSHGIFGANLYEKNKERVYLCEGPWDAMALWEVLRQTKESDDGYARTSNPSLSLLSECNVLAVPGITTFKDAWFPLFNKKEVVILFDNDHPKMNEKAGTMGKPEAFEATKRIAEMLDGRCQSISYLKWGELGYNSDLPSGYDVRDLLNAES